MSALVGEVFEMWDAAKRGEISRDAWVRRALDLYFNPACLLADIESMKVAELKATLAHMNMAPRASKKADLAQEVYKRIGDLLLLPGKTLAYTVSFEEIRAGRGEEIRLTHVRDALEAITDDDMAAYVEKHAKARAQREAALDNPTTLEEFVFFMRAKGVEALSDEQMARFDALVWERDRAAVQAEQERRAQIKEIDLGDVEMAVFEETHTQKDVPIWIVRLNQRVEADLYRQLADAADLLGGKWSRFSNGFLFWEKEDAEQFAGVTDGGADASERWARRRRVKEDRAADRLAQYAARKDGAAMDALTADRLVNTVRRARMAHDAEQSAREEQALAATIASVATAQAQGLLTVLANVRSAIQVAELAYLLRRAMYDAARAKGEAPESSAAVRYSEAGIRHASYPWPSIPSDDAQRMAATLKGKRGAGSHLKIFHAMLERSDGRIVQARTKAEAETVVALVGMISTSAYWADALKARTLAYSRLERMGIDNLPILRYALRELLPHVVAPAQADPVTTAERNLIGVKIPGYFPTPADIVDDLVASALVGAGMCVLEPSAGKGNIITGLLNAGAHVKAIEVNATLIGLLEMKFAGSPVETEQCDFLEVRPFSVDRVVMNPPFENGQDIDHVRHAYQFLRNGGRLVAIMSAGAFYREDAKATAFRQWLKGVGGREVGELPAGTFYHEAGTNVVTRMILIDKR